MHGRWQGYHKKVDEINPEIISKDLQLLIQLEQTFSLPTRFQRRYVRGKKLSTFINQNNKIYNFNVMFFCLFLTGKKPKMLHI